MQVKSYCLDFMACYTMTDVCCRRSVCRLVMRCLDEDDSTTVASALRLGMTLVEVVDMNNGNFDLDAQAIEDAGYKWPRLRVGATILANRIRDLEDE